MPYDVYDILMYSLVLFQEKKFSVFMDLYYMKQR